MKAISIILFSLISFVSQSQVFIKVSQLNSNCINLAESNEADISPDFSGCAYEADEVTQNVYDLSEFKNGELISRITFDLATGLVQSSYNSTQKCEYFADGRLKYRCTYGTNQSKTSEIQYKIEKEKYFVYTNKTYDNAGKLIECSGKGCE
jgi:hypothetical protein